VPLTPVSDLRCSYHGGKLPYKGVLHLSDSGLVFTSDFLAGKKRVRFFASSRLSEHTRCSSRFPLARCSPLPRRAQCAKETALRSA
jgi:hypothetical protein